MTNSPECREQIPAEPFAVTKRLSRELVEGTGIDGVGVAVFASEATRDLVFATDSVAEELDEMQFTLGEGPCLDAFRFHRPELHDDIVSGEALARWPAFSAQSAALGAASVYAYPLAEEGGAPFGVLELYGRLPVSLSAQEEASCRLFAASIGRAVLSELAPVHALISRPDDGVFRRGNVNVAAGMLAVQLQVSVEEALVRLRARAFSRQRRITAIAGDVIGDEEFDADAS
ncbi:GAF and ANTAR domain-containing protein [Rhodococcus qingshengii]|uniref:GAF and ANTAR domain-containing protein n=1 Tax=Rhodococcus qingshengii TaxID=334542 RepID=UPI001BEC5089|nr:GAF and ANTAR domain-containing protein [Rhodococcus qingshengii]MBT2274159.1 GAF and ANTAR domain-containing protein [Rhodococcus qingshengii]